jgi:hypothetical protein
MAKAIAIPTRRELRGRRQRICDALDESEHSRRAADAHEKERQNGRRGLVAGVREEARHAEGEDTAVQPRRADGGEVGRAIEMLALRTHRQSFRVR